MTFLQSSPIDLPHSENPYQKEIKITPQDDRNLFTDMGFIQFWIVSAVFWMTFPASIVLCYLTMGSIRTKQFVKALINDLLQTILVILVVVCVLIYVVYNYVSGLF